MKTRFHPVALLMLSSLPLVAADLQWKHLSSAQGDLSPPGNSTEQTASTVADLDRDGKNDFVVTMRRVAPAVVMYRRNSTGWDRYVIEPALLNIEAGGVAFDVDGDGDLDLIFGGDGQSSDVWWWENPYPQFDPNVAWRRHVIKTGGATQHHDQAIADFLGTGKPQLAFWNQRARKLFLAETPTDPRSAASWPLTEIFATDPADETGKPAHYYEGATAIDVDGDGQVDVVAGRWWFKHRGGKKFDAIQISTLWGRIAAGHFKPGKVPQIVIGPGDVNGPLRFYECGGNPEDPSAWLGRDLLDREMVHGHSLQVADIDGDGNLDIFAAEMAKWGRSIEIDNPKATAWILLGDGRGGFRRTIFQTGFDFHEAKVADLDGDGRMDVLSKPYTWEAPRLDVWLQVPSAKLTSAKAPATRRTGHGSVVPPEARFHGGAIGLELYSFRAKIATDLAGTLARARALGIVDVEVPNLYQHSAAEFRAELDKAGLKCTSFIANYEQLRTDLDGIAASAKTLGAAYVVCSRIPGERTPETIFTVQQAENAAKDFNDWGRRLHDAGLQFCYHPHGFEFREVGDGTVFDHLVAATDANHVKFELDVFWMIYPGRDPVAFLKKYPGRFPLMHPKDLQRGVKGDQSGKAPLTTNVTLGQGQANWAAIFAAAKMAGVQHYYIEDESPESERQVPVGIEFMATHFPAR